jgi:sulfate adenylyltransferase subunit 1 (EFTu-like GTPase family)
MDLVGFDQDVFEKIHDDFEELLSGATLHAIPVSALHGDNVITRSDRTPWFDGQSLLEYLETTDVDRNVSSKPFRMPVQLVIRPSDDFRGYAGQIVTGTIKPGDAITVSPSGRRATVARIVTWDGDLDIARAPQSVTLVLKEEVDVSRGDVLAAAGDVAPYIGNRFEAEIVWMDERPLDPARTYLVKHTTQTTTADLNRGLVLNQIGPVTVTTMKPLIFDRYAENRGTGGFIIIDPATQFTAGAGLSLNPMLEKSTSTFPTAAERLARLARTAGSEEEAVEAIRRALEEMLA